MKEVNCNGAGESPGQEGRWPEMEAYNEWYEANEDTLIDQYIKDNPEEFPTDDSMCECDRNPGFQIYVETQWEIHKEGW
jgi:hypothetical protein